MGVRTWLKIYDDVLRQARPRRTRKLAHSQPAVWRRVRASVPLNVASNTTLLQLHTLCDMR
jgi:hypothetical protein